MRLDLALSDNQMAWLQGPALAVPMALGSIPLGLMVDRRRRGRLFQIFVALTLAATVLTALTANLALLFAARALVGLAVAAIFVAAYSTVADLFPTAQRGCASMVVALGEIGGAPSAFALGGALLAMIASASAATAGTGLGTAGWRWALLWMSVPLVPVTLL